VTDYLTLAEVLEMHVVLDNALEQASSPIRAKAINGVALLTIVWMTYLSGRSNLGLRILS
jgi:hypothetical protein